MATAPLLDVGSLSLSVLEYSGWVDAEVYLSKPVRTDVFVDRWRGISSLLRVHLYELKAGQGSTVDQQSESGKSNLD